MTNFSVFSDLTKDDAPLSSHTWVKSLRESNNIMRLSRITSLVSHAVVACITAVLVLNFQVIRDPPLPNNGALSPSNLMEQKAEVQGKEVEKFIAPSEQLLPKVKRRPRIDFGSCPADRLMVSPRVNYLVGMGHKMTEAFWFLWYAITHGYCYCFAPDKFGDDVDIYHLLLEPLLPPCPANRTFNEISVKDLEKSNITALDKSIIQFLEPDMGQVWAAEQKTRKRGFGDVLAFVDSFMRDNNLMEDVMYPWYQKHKSIGSAFLKGTDTAEVVTAAFHLRVGDVVLEANESYWRNVLQSLRAIVDEEHSPGKPIQVYWVYFQAIFRGGPGTRMRDKLSRNVVGEWPSEDDMLPTSHKFLSTICREIENMQCLWKEGANILESIDLFVESDALYVSGSSFSQVLSVFNRKDGIKLLALPKELNYWGKVAKDEVPFLQAHTGAFSSLRYYYIDGTGEVFSEQFAHLRWKGLSSKRG